MRGRLFTACTSWTLLVPLAATAVLGLAACGSDGVTDPPLPSDAIAFSPLPVYSTWWNMTQACSGIPGSLGAVTWYKTDQDLRGVSGEALSGYWTSIGNRIVLTTASVRDGGVVRHEMLHALLRVPGHPRDAFLGKCAGTVHCQGACIQDAGPYPTPPESPIHVTADSIDFSVSVQPTNPTSGVDGGFFSITVVAHNRSAHWATATPVSPAHATDVFSFDVRSTSTSSGMSTQEIALDPSQRIFAPGETKKQVFDFIIGDDPFANQLLAGDYIVRGGFAGYWSTYSPFVIGP